MADFYLDEPVAELLAVSLRRNGHDAVNTAELGRKGSSDARQMHFATRTGRILVTHDLHDFPMLHEAWHGLAREWAIVDRRIHPGILIVPPTTRLSVADATREIETLLGSQETTDRLFVWMVPTGWQERFA